MDNSRVIHGIRHELTTTPILPFVLYKLRRGLNEHQVTLSVSSLLFTSRDLTLTKLLPFHVPQDVLQELLGLGRTLPLLLQGTPLKTSCDL